MPRKYFRKKLFLVATSVTAVVLVSFVISAIFYEQFITYSYVVLGMYFAFFIFYQVYDFYKSQRR
ncbi:MAG TPA: hypothetical protein VIL03_02480 [Clostridia bacterium]